VSKSRDQHSGLGIGLGLERSVNVSVSVLRANLSARPPGQTFALDFDLEARGPIYKISDDNLMISYDNAKVTVDLLRTTYLQNVS